MYANEVNLLGSLNMQMSAGSGKAEVLARDMCSMIALSSGSATRLRVAQPHQRSGFEIGARKRLNRMEMGFGNRVA